jgi:hypothetical protein
VAFNIHELDDFDEYSEEAEEALASYQDALMDLFWDSPEGVELRKDFPDMGFFAAQFIHYGYSYTGAAIPQMTVSYVDEIVTQIFPEKISLSSPDVARQTLPELVAFWLFLQREFKLPNAAKIIKFLKEIGQDKLAGMMNDPSRFGMAKSFFMAGQLAGFDMTDEKQMRLFQSVYNQALMADFEKAEERKVEPSGNKTQEAEEKQAPRTAKVVKAVKAARKRGRRKSKGK